LNGAASMMRRRLHLERVFAAYRFARGARLLEGGYLFRTSF